MDTEKARHVLIGLTRISLGTIFFWAFLDKAFGLGFRTAAGNAWSKGGSPTQGFLGGVDGWFEPLFTRMAGNVIVDALFMIGLLGIGLALILGIGVKIAGYSGALLLFLMYLAVLPFEKGVDAHPFMDDHIIYALVLLWMTVIPAGVHLGLGEWWKRQKLVQEHPILE